MKKTLLTLAVVATSAASVFAQGKINIYNITTAYLTYTNSGAYQSSDNGVYNTTGGKATTAANGFYYALLVQPDTSTITAINPLDPNYTLAAMATNYLVAGGLSAAGAGGTSGQTVANWAAPTGATYNTAPNQDYYLLVGWSASLGTTWSAVSAELAANNWAANGVFGVSQLGVGYAGGGPNSVTPPYIFGTGVNPGGLSQGVTLFSVTSAPEPASMALIGLGGASLLLFRRKK